MKIIKVLNNNSLVAVDSEQHESILIGKGLAFGKKPGDQVEPEQAQKRYNLDNNRDNAETRRLIQLIQDIPLETLKLSSRIVDYARNKLDRPISQTIEIAITDHIHYMLIRLEKGVVFEHYFLWEMKRFYPKEYETALEAIHSVNERYQTKIPDSEASFIALHLVNESFGSGNIQEVLTSTKLIHDILNIIQYHFNVELQTDCFNYQRFITHLKFFSSRIISGEMLNEREYYLYDFMKMKYKDIFQCAMKIDALLEKEFNKRASQEELAYLMVHIERVLHHENE